MRKLLPLMAFFFVCTIMSAQTIVFQDDFESYTAGQTVASQSTNWTPWSGGTTGAEAALVSITQAHSGVNSMNVIPNNDMIYSFGNKTSGVYQIDFEYYVATGSQGYFNIEHAFGSEWAFSCEFANGTLTLNNSATPTTYTYTPDAWMLFTIDVDIAADAIHLNLNGTELTTWTFSTQEDGTAGINQLGCINFYGPAGNNFFVDDFVYTEIQSGLVPPTIDIVTTTIVTDGTAPVVHPFSNTGEEVMNYTTFAKFADPAITSTLTAGQMNYDGDNTSAIGWANSFEVYAAVRIGNGLTSTHVGQQISSVDIFINEAPSSADITVYVWSKGGFITPGTTTILAEKVFTPTAAAWNTITLDSPVLINGDEIWVGYKFTGTAGGYTLGVDGVANLPGTCYLKTGPVWSEFSGITGSGNFNIRANVDGAGWPVWLTVAPGSGTVAAAGSSNITLNFNTTDLTTGTYNSTVVIGANDPAQEWTEIPVQLDYVVGIDNVTRIGVMTYPNPATDNINVVSDATINTVTVYSVTGQLINTYNVNATTTSIDVTGMAKGNYVIEVKAGNNVVKSNIVVK